VKAGLSRFQRNFPDAIGNARKGLTSAPNDPQVKLEYHLAIGRILYSSGYDIAAIAWLEKAEKFSSALPISSEHLDVLGHLSFAWASKFNYARALEYGEKLVKTADNTDYGYRHRLALFELGNLLSSVGQERKAKELLEKGLEFSLKAKDDYQSCLFLNTLILTSLYKGDIELAEKHLLSLERIDRNKRFMSAATLGKAVVAALQGQDLLSEKHFKELALLKSYSDHIIPYWRLTLAEHKKDWMGMIERGEALRKISEEQNFRDDLPGIYLSLAKGYWGLGKLEPTLEHARQTAAMIESDRPVGDAPLSLAVLETYHSVYRLLAEAEERNNIAEALELADYLKGRVLRDRIENSVLRRRSDIGIEVRVRAEELSTQFIEGDNAAESKLARLEKSATLARPDGAGTRLERGRIEQIAVPERTAIISYFFTLSGELRAYVVKKTEQVRIVKLSISEKEAEVLAESVRTNIRDRIFFKSNGKKIYDRLLAPLSLDADHIVIIPDKALWKIPFHALSADTKSYLIEQKTISYAPSVSILADMLRAGAPIRKTAQVFANDTYDKRHLPFVNREATEVARILEVRPFINATPRQFRSSAGGSDILHFSMHAQTDPDDPLGSFLAFRPREKHNGRVTVEDLLKVRLKHQSLAFLASCETNQILNSEGVVSLAWALLGSGSTSVVSAQWEVNDRSTETFTETFYTEYRKGVSVAQALQVASITMIRNKASGSHEPYYWAPFLLIGDYR